jgi:alpha,alpha-trehalase
MTDMTDMTCRFGWTNASYVYGLSLLSLHAKRALGVNAPYEVYAKAVTEPGTE